MSAELLEVLRAQGARWPAMTARDILKLLYQHSFGGGHLIEDEEKMAARLEEEYRQAEPCPGLPLFEPLGGGWARLHLAPARKAGLSAGLIGRMFRASARPKPEGALLQGVDEWKSLAWQGVFPHCTLAQAEACLAEYKGGPVSHSEAYRQAYHPAYRVVDARLIPLLPLLRQIDETHPRRVALDGRSASGKTTAARLVAQIFGFGLVHMDDFYLPPALRTAARLAEPGGNLHYERFEEEVLAPLRENRPFSYGVYDCATGQIREHRRVDGSGPVLVEGAYCMRPGFGSPYDLTAFYDIDPETQKKRILARNGPEAARRFESLWIPLENRYHSACHTAARADLVLRAPREL